MNKNEAAVRLADDNRVQSLLDANYEKFAQLLSDKLVYHHASGKVDDKDSYLSQFLSGKVRFVSINRRDLRIDIVGSTAICRGIAENELSVDGAPVHTGSRFFSVWAQDGDGWRMVAWSSAPLD
jgi:hypothetical protein